MANEAVQVEGPYTTHDWTVGDTSGIEQFTLMIGGDPRTAQASTSGDSAPIFAGIAMTEKEASSGQTNLGLTKEGIFVLTANPNADVTMGAKVVISGVNVIRDAVAGDLLTGAIVGTAIEAIAKGTTGEVMLVGNT